MIRHVDVNIVLDALCNNCDRIQAVCPHYPCMQYTSIEELPIADVVEVKHGKWIKADTHNYWFFKKNDRIYKCSICGNLLDFEGVNGGRGDTAYCPNCGARMDEREEE